METDDGDNFGRETHHNPDAFWNSTGKKVWQIVMAPLGLDYENIGWDDLVGDNALQLMTDFCNRCRSNPPVSDQTKAPYGVASLQNTLGAVIRLLQVKFSVKLQNQPEMFPQEEVKKWRRQLKNDHNRGHMQGDDESEVLKSCFPIPRNHNKRTVLFSFDDFPDAARREDSRKTDMKSICERLFSRERFTENLKTQFTFFGIGRGGEVKFLNYNRWMFDEYYCMLFAQWFQRKILKTNPSGFVPDYEYPEMSTWLGMGCFWACENGLARPEGIGEPHSPLRRKATFVFQDLHDMRDKSVAGQVSSIIKSVIVPQLKAFFSAKSLRYGAMSHLTWDPSVTYDEAVALGGWSTQSNSDWYVWMYLVSVIPGALCLAGYPDPRVLPYLPSAGKIFYHGEPNQRMSPDQFTSLINELYVISLLEFKAPHGRLRPLLVSVTASMIMHFDYCYKKYGGNHRYVRKMINCTIKAGIASTESSAIVKLQFWSVTILEDFKSGNVVGHTDVLHRRSIPDQIEKMNATVAQLLKAKIDMQAQLMENQRAMEGLIVKVDSLSTTVQTLLEHQNAIHTQNSLLILQNREMMRKIGIDVPTQPPQLPTPPTVNMTTTSPPRINAAVTPAPAQPTNTNVSPTPVALALQRPRGNDATRRRGQRAKEQTVEYVLREMYDAPRNIVFSPLQRASVFLEDRSAWVFNKIFAANDKRNMLKIQRSLQLIDALWTPDERQKIIYHRLDSLSAIRLFGEISKRVVNAAHVLKSNTPKTGYPCGRAGAGLLGLANNIRHFNLESYIPNWETDSSITAPETLLQLAERKREQIIANNSNRQP